MKHVRKFNLLAAILAAVCVSAHAWAAPIGGGVGGDPDTLPHNTPTPIPTATPTPTPAPTATPSSVVSTTPTPEPTHTPGTSGTGGGTNSTPTATPSATAHPTATPTPTPSPATCASAQGSLSSGSCEAIELSANQTVQINKYGSCKIISSDSSLGHDKILIPLSFQKEWDGTGQGPATSKRVGFLPFAPPGVGIGECSTSTCDTNKCCTYTGSNVDPDVSLGDPRLTWGDLGSCTTPSRSSHLVKALQGYQAGGPDSDIISVSGCALDSSFGGTGHCGAVSASPSPSPTATPSPTPTPGPLTFEVCCGNPSTCVTNTGGASCNGSCNSFRVINSPVATADGFDGPAIPAFNTGGSGGASGSWVSVQGAWYTEISTWNNGGGGTGGGGSGGSWGSGYSFYNATCAIAPGKQFNGPTTATVSITACINSACQSVTGATLNFPGAQYISTGITTQTSITYSGTCSGTISFNGDNQSFNFAVTPGGSAWSPASTSITVGGSTFHLETAGGGASTGYSGGGYGGSGNLACVVQHD